MDHTQNLETVIIEPAQKARQSVIWLHGLGANGHDFVDIIPEMRLPNPDTTRFIFPHAPIQPVTINGNMEMRAWFDIYSLNRLEREDTTGLAAQQQIINQLIDQEKLNGIEPKHIVLAGFSQGAAMALHTGLRYPEPLAGILALSGYLPQMNKLTQAANPHNRSTPILFAHGTNDSIVPIELGKSSYACLKAAGYPATWNAYPMEHQVCAEEIIDIATWLQQVLPELGKQGR